MEQTVADRESGGSRMRWLWLAVVVILVDQGTKLLASSLLSYGQPLPVLPLFNLTLLHNTGAAFSFLAGESGWQRWLFVLLAIIVSVVLVRWLSSLRRHETWMAIAIALILGGALGNVLDRIVHGYVVDFIHLYWGSYHFPAFNLADSAITIGAVMMVIDMFRKPSGQSNQGDAAG